MKTIIITLTTILCSVVVLGQVKTAEDDPHWPQQIVRRAFDEVSAGLRTSWSERYLARLGDSAAPEIRRCISERPSTKENAETALALVKMSFANPRSIRHEQDRTPTNTLALLDYFDKHSADADVKLKVDSVRDELRARSPAVEPKKNSNN